MPFQKYQGSAIVVRWWTHTIPHCLLNDSIYHIIDLRKDYMQSICLILHTPFENSTTRIAIRYIYVVLQVIPILYILNVIFLFLMYLFISYIIPTFYPAQKNTIYIYLPICIQFKRIFYFNRDTPATFIQFLRSLDGY